MRVAYVAGPMTHYPQFNYPVFERVALAMRGMPQFARVITPIDGDPPDLQAQARASVDGSADSYTVNTYGECIARGVRLVLDEPLNDIVLLAGWEESKGTRLEVLAGILKGGIDFHRVKEISAEGVVTFKSITAQSMKYMLADAIV